MSRTRTNLARIVVAAMLALSACLVVWWPQGAAGSDGPTPSASAAATTATPSPTKTPSVTISPTPTRTPSVTISSAAPPAAPTTQAAPTSKPSSRDGGHTGGGHTGNGGSNNSGNTMGNNSNSNSGGKPSGSKPSSKPSTPTTVSTPSGGDTDVDVAPPPPADTGAADPGGKATDKGQGAKTPTATPTEAPTVEPTDDGSLKQVGTTQTYLTSPEPVETKSAPVWVVPGILLMLTSMLALLGGVIGRNKRTVKDEA